MIGIPRPRDPRPRPTPAQLMAALVDVAWKSRRTRQPVAELHTAAGCQRVTLTAEEAAYAAERATAGPVGWDCVDGWTVGDILAREA